MAEICGAQFPKLHVEPHVPKAVQKFYFIFFIFGLVLSTLSVNHGFNFFIYSWASLGTEIFKGELDPHRRSRVPSHYSTCRVCVPPHNPPVSSPHSTVGEGLWMPIVVCCVEERNRWLRTGFRRQRKWEGMCAEPKSPCLMLHSPIKLDPQNSNSEIKLIQISRWCPQSIKPQGWLPSKCGFLCKCIGHMPLKLTMTWITVEYEN